MYISRDDLEDNKGNPADGLYRKWDAAIFLDWDSPGYGDRSDISLYAIAFIHELCVHGERGKEHSETGIDEAYQCENLFRKELGLPLRDMTNPSELVEE